MFKFARLFMGPALAALVLFAPAAVAPREAPAARADFKVLEGGPYKTFQEADEKGAANAQTGAGWYYTVEHRSDGYYWLLFQKS